MKLLNLRGRAIYKNVRSRRIKWDECKKSQFQYKVKSLLRPFWQNDIVYEEFPVYGSRLTLDFFNATKRIAVEVQGSQHTKFSKFFHGSRAKFQEQLIRDESKMKFCEINNIKLVEVFWEEKDSIDIEFLKTVGLV